MELTEFPGGITSFGMPIVGGNYITSGDVYFVHNDIGSNGKTGKDTNHPFGTITYSITQATTNKYDHIFVMPGHAVTRTAALSLNVAGVTLIGIGASTLKPTITGNGAVDAVSLDAANVIFNNFHIAAPLTDAQTSMINIDAAGCQVRNISGIGSTGTENIVDCITVTANANDLTIDGVELWNSVVAVNSFLSLEGAAARVAVKNFFAFGDVSTAGIIDAAKIAYLFLENIRLGVVGTTKPAITLDSNPEGYARNCFFAGTHGTLATNANLGNLMREFDCYILKQTDGSKSGLLQPVVDA